MKTSAAAYRIHTSRKRSLFAIALLCAYTAGVGVGWWLAPTDAPNTIPAGSTISMHCHYFVDYRDDRTCWLEVDLPDGKRKVIP